MTKTQQIRVLIVDDEDRFRATTAAILQRRGFEVTAVGSAFEALDTLKSSDFDVVILDVKMPGMDGNQALPEIKRLKPETEVIMLTGHGSAVSAVAGLTEGVYDYLSKPCDIDLLARKINDAALKKNRVSREEQRVRDIMIPLNLLRMIDDSVTVEDAIMILQDASAGGQATMTVSESGQSSIVVIDSGGEVIGLLGYLDLLRGLQPNFMEILQDSPSLSDISYLDNSLNWSGFFTIMTRDIAKMKVRTIMSDLPPTIDEDANLMLATSRMTTKKVRELLVVNGELPTGIIREQDLVYEMARIIKMISS